MGWESETESNLSMRDLSLLLLHNGLLFVGGNLGVRAVGTSSFLLFGVTLGLRIAWWSPFGRMDSFSFVVFFFFFSSWRCNRLNFFIFFCAKTVYYPIIPCLFIPNPCNIVPGVLGREGNPRYTWNLVDTYATCLCSFNCTNSFLEILPGAGVS